jgi:hypothetical protein
MSVFNVFWDMTLHGWVMPDVSFKKMITAYPETQHHIAEDWYSHVFSRCRT